MHDFIILKEELELIKVYLDMGTYYQLKKV